jgi:hypothetical protein
MRKKRIHSQIISLTALVCKTKLSCTSLLVYGDITKHEYKNDPLPLEGGAL